MRRPHRVYTKTHHINFLNCKFVNSDTNGTREAGSEIFKSSQSEYLLVQDCELSTTTTQSPTDSSVGMDWVWVSYSTARRVYMHDYYHCGIYWKGGSQYDVLEDSVVANGRTTTYCSGIYVGGDGTGIEYANPNATNGLEYSVMRNNIVTGTTNGGVTICTVNWYWFYNNLVVNVGNGSVPCCGGNGCSPFAPGMRPYLNCHDYDGTGFQHIRVFNNIFLDTAGIMAYSYGLDIGTVTDWVSGNNCWWNNGSTVPDGNLWVNGVQIKPSTETGTVIANPNLTLSGSRSTWQNYVDYYRPTSNSTAIRDVGNSNAGVCPYPGVLADIEGTPRPRGSGWDMGPYEYPGAVVTPVADFGADNTLGAAPFTVNFTDYSTGGPTAWSWTFGDGGASTVQNPSYTYTTFGNYTVALTATNSAGSNTCTKSGYITIKPLLAGFTANTTWGTTPLNVNFSDQSTNSPTAWSWTFGDGGSSTAQNPSHTYTTIGAYNVTLQATNANGSDTCTKSGYVGTCSATVLTPTSWSSMYGLTVVSGTLADLSTQDGVALELACDPTNQRGEVKFQVSSGDTQSQIRAVTYETCLRSNDATTPDGEWWVDPCGNSVGQSYYPAWGTSYIYQTATYSGDKYPYPG